MNNSLTVVMRNVARILMKSVQTGITYEKWSDEFSYKEIKESDLSIKEHLSVILGDITKLSKEELNILGFEKWEERDLYLIPLWAFDLIPDGTELESIGGDKVIKGKDEIDLDVRFGCIAYGLKLN